MKAIIDNNFLNGTLTLDIDEKQKTVFGIHKFYDETTDEFYTFTAFATCAKEDNFSEKKGIELVKSKLARQYHQFYMQDNRLAIDVLESVLKKHKQEYEFRKKKLENIEKSLKEDYGLNFYSKKKPKKVVKKTTKTKK